LIAYNGALTQHPHSQEILRQWQLPPAIALGILDYFESPDLRHKLEVHCYHNDQLYVREITPETERYMARSGMAAQAIGDLRPMIERGTVKLLAISQNSPLIQSLITELRQQYSPQEVHLTQSTEIYFEITHPHANKGLAIQHLAEDILGLQPENVLAIGDNFNDQEMITYAGIGVAMGNAPEPIKAIADWVTGDVEEDGVKQALEKFCL
jgi:Cof subfamily protein (haloacid dehalogenase superfamily)